MVAASFPVMPFKKSSTVRASKSRPITKPVTVTIATSDEGTAVVNFGKK